MKEGIRELILKSGAIAVGFASAGEVDNEIHRQYTKWIEEGYHGEMNYLCRHIPLKKSTDNVLKDSRTVISCAFSYVPQEWLSEKYPAIASYAYGEDYHIVLRDILNPLIDKFQKEFGGKWRICIDSAPVSERFWAMKAGIGKLGLNGAIITDNCGSLCFLVEILTTLEIEPDPSSYATCEKCGLCIKLCPGKALSEDKGFDARKCINYLTIEKAGEFTEEEIQILNSNSGFLFGCDICLRVCPNNVGTKTSDITRFRLGDKIKNLTPEKILNFSEEEFKECFKGSPLLYAGYQRLKRNAKALIKNKRLKS